MNWKIAQTLWDLITSKPQGQSHVPFAEASEARQGTVQHNASKDGRVGSRSKRPVVVHEKKGKLLHRVPMQQRYDELVIEMKRRYGIRVRKWRNSSSGCAWEVRYSTGSVARLIESPYPRGPMSCAIFLHEIGHHAIGFRTYRPRCLEEYHAWKWSLDTMRAHGFNVTAAVQKRMDDSLRYAVAKAKRRGLRKLPIELAEYSR